MGVQQNCVKMRHSCYIYSRTEILYVLNKIKEMCWLFLYHLHIYFWHAIRATERYLYLFQRTVPPPFPISLIHYGGVLQNPSVTALGILQWWTHLRNRDNYLNKCKFKFILPGAMGLLEETIKHFSKNLLFLIKKNLKTLMFVTEFFHYIEECHD